MANNLFNMFGNSTASLPGPFGNIQQFMSQLNQFKNQFHGDPQQKIQELLNSGQMTQEQFNKYKQMADQLMGMMK